MMIKRSCFVYNYKPYLNEPEEQKFKFHKTEMWPTGRVQTAKVDGRKRKDLGNLS